MVSAHSLVPETVDRWATLSARPWNDWSHDDKRLFIAFVDEQKANGGKGSVTKACERYGVKQVTLGYWRRTLTQQRQENGESDAAGSNGREEVAKSPDSSENPKLVASTIDARRAELVAKLRTAIAIADTAAMELKDPLTEALVMSLAMRAYELETRYGAITTPVVEPPQPPDNALMASEQEDPSTEKTADAAPTPAETEPTSVERDPAAIVAVVRADAERTITPPPAEHAAETAKPAPETKPPLSQKERRMQSLEMSLGITGSHERLIALGTEECMRRFNAAHPNAGWLEKNEYEEFAKRMLANFDTEKSGNVIHHVERSFVTSKTRRINRDRVGELSRAFLRHAFAMAEDHAKRDDLPLGVTFDRLKSEAYQTFTFLAGIHDPEDTGDFWSWAEPRIQESLDAMCGGMAVSYFGAKEKRKAEERQKPVFQMIMERAISRQMSMRKKPEDEARHAAMVTYINGLAEEGRADGIDDVLLALLKMYTNDIENAADQAHAEGVRPTIDECMELLVQSTLKSVWLFDTRRRGNLDEYIRNGWTLALRR